MLASGGYPAAQFPTGFPITGLGQACPTTCRLITGATRRDAQPASCVTNGGRVLVLAAHGHDLASRRGRAPTRSLRQCHVSGCLLPPRHCPAPRARCSPKTP
ncbi:MAG: phosphoribosylglycinamide synthetase C domain-containing protein [Hymenobacter sp.]